MNKPQTLAQGLSQQDLEVSQGQSTSLRKDVLMVGQEVKKNKGNEYDGRELEGRGGRFKRSGTNKEDAGYCCELTQYSLG